MSQVVFQICFLNTKKFHIHKHILYIYQFKPIFNDLVTYNANIIDS